MAKCSVCFSRLLSSHTHTHTWLHDTAALGAALRSVVSTLPGTALSSRPHRFRNTRTVLSLQRTRTGGGGRLGAAPDLLLCFLLALHFRPLLVRGWVRRLYSEALPTTPSARWLGKAWFPSSVEPGREEEGLSGRELTGQELVGKGSKIKLKPSKQGWRL